MALKIILIKSLLLSDFPSGSSINYHQGKLYLIGDDATHILVLDNDYKKLDSVFLFDYAEKRIPKVDKTDLEGSVIFDIKGVPHLLIVGSASRKNRKRVIVIPFSETGLNFHSQKNSFYKTKNFTKRIRSNNIDEVNLEAVCYLKNDLILGNRGNLSTQTNQLIITDHDFWEHQDDARIIIRNLVVPSNYSSEPLGLSELCYVAEMDLLFITLTSEATANAYDDGEIGNSYLGWIKSASEKLTFEDVTPDGIINLSDVDPSFTKEKIEGICVEAVSADDMTIHLIADNDAGESRLFKLKVPLDLLK